MSSVRRVVIVLLASVALLLTAPSAVTTAHAEERTRRTFVTSLSATNEVPACPAGVESGARGVAVVHVNADSGEIRYWVVAKNLPAPIPGSPGAHIHVQDPSSPTGRTGPIVVHFEPTGRNNGLVAAGMATNPAVAAAILADPENYYVNVHTTACPPGTVRGQLG